MTHVKQIIVAGLVGMGVLCTVHAVPTLNTPEQWNAVDGIAGWNQSGGNLVNPGSGGNPGGYLQLEMPASEWPIQYQIYADGTTAGGIYAGNQNYSGAEFGGDTLIALFDFRYDNVAPAGLSLYFQSGNNIWLRPVDTLPAQGAWGSYKIPFAWGDGTIWGLDIGGGDRDLFVEDLMDVDRVGLWVPMGMETGSEFIGFDNFELRIPEPNTVFFLSAVLLSLGASFRRNVVDGLRWARGLVMKA
jgi:hypothetical protein